MRFHVNQHIFYAAKACSKPKTPVLVYKAAHLLPFLLFATLVSTGQTVLISADFESDFPAGWDQQTLSTDGGWLVGSHAELQSQYFPMTPHGQFIATNDDACDCDKSADYLMLPAVDLSDVQQAFLVFESFYDGQTLFGGTETATIEYSLDAGDTWTVLETMEASGEEDGMWDAVSVDLAALMGFDSVTLAFRYNDDDNWLFGWGIDNVLLFEPSGLDLSLAALNLPSQVEAGEDVVIAGAVVNMGEEVINTFELNWNGAEQEGAETFTDLALAPGELYAFEHAIAFVPDASGQFTIEASVGLVNETTDNVSENNTATTTLQAYQNESMNVGGLDRDFLFYRASSAPDDAPLVLVYHGYTGSAAGIMQYSDFNSLAEEFGFAVCYPQGSQDSFGSTFFNVGYDFQVNETVDDVAFTLELISLLSEEQGIDQGQVFATGMSNGGDFCYLLACEASDSFRGFAPISGMIMQDIMDTCTPQYQTSILEIHGTDDNVTYYNGDPSNIDGWGAYPSIPATMDFFADLFNLDTSTTFNLPDLDPEDGSTVYVEQHSAEATCTQLWLYTVEGGGHDWPGAFGNMDIEASREAWMFFEQLCDQTTPVGLSNITHVPQGRLIKVTDLLGRTVQPTSGQLLLYIYDNGTIEKRFSH